MELVTNGPNATTTENPVHWKKELLVCLLLSVTFGIFVCIASDKMLNRQDHRPVSVGMERSILRGQPFSKGDHLVYMPPWQNRILFPAVLELGTRLGIFTANGWYVLLRLIFSIAMFATFWLVLRRTAQAEPKLAGAGLLLLAYCLVCTFNIPYGLSSDFADAMFTAVFIAATLRHKRLLVLILSIVAAANRESSAFAGIIWLFLYGMDKNRKINMREVGYGVLVSISSYASVVLLRYGFGGRQAIGSNTQFVHIKNNLNLLRDFVQHPTPLSWAGLLFCTIVPCLIWIVSNRQGLAFTHKALLGAACAIAAISLGFGNIGEPRIFIPATVLTIFVAIWAEAAAKPHILTNL